MADTPVSQEEQALRRRARRRLVGAIALALLAVVVLPMLFDPEPKPLGGNVEIRIPGQDTPFDAAPLTAAPIAPVAEPAPAAAEVPPPPPLIEATAEPEPAPPSKPPVPKPVAPAATEAKSAPVPKPAPAKAAESKPAKAPQAAESVYLQLGVFSSEANARRLVEKANAAGFQASVVSGGGQSRVRMGPYAEREQALAVQARLKTKGLNSVVVAR